MTANVRTRTTSRFGWEALGREQLEAIVHTLRRRDERARIRVADASDRQLRTVCDQVLGSPPRMEVMPWFSAVLIRVWLPSAPLRALEKLTTTLQLLEPNLRARRARSRAAMERMVRDSRKTDRFKEELRKAFISSARVRSSRPPTAVSGSRVEGKLELRGEGAERLTEPYAHQREAWERLDRLARQETGLGMMVVLPTGAGKTDVAVEWALDRMEADETVRVLWVAHQRQLVEQAAARMSAAARHRETSFRRTARIIHGGASRMSLLAEESTAVALATVQTLTQAPMAKKEPLLQRFMDHPTIVVIDEAHRVGSASYERLLDLAAGSSGVAAIIGLSATPEPVGMHARRAVARRFPAARRVAQVGREELIAKGVLARPVFHPAVPTGVKVRLSGEELAQTRGRSELPGRVTRRLDTASRNRLVLQTWLKGRKGWGKTLVFALDIEHAETLGALFLGAGISTRVLHSRSETPRQEALRWFTNAEDDAVLISVGMLTEGVDLPDARTAFLARPTSSHVLLSQMIGRVLRGPAAGGEPTANIVYFEDDWVNFSGVLTPQPDVLIEDDDRPTRPPVDGPEAWEDVPPSVRDAVEALLGSAEDGPVEAGSEEALVHTSITLREVRSLGYYRCEEDDGIPSSVLVLEGQERPFDDFFSSLDTRDANRSGDPFADCPPPVPPEWQLQELADFVRRTGQRPEFIRFEMALGPRATAQALLSAPAMDERGRYAFVEAEWNSPRGAGFATQTAFAEAVNQAARDLCRNRNRPDGDLMIRPDKPPLPGSDRRGQRWLEQRMEHVVRVARVCLADEPELRRLRPPKVEWTRRPITTAFAYHRVFPGRGVPKEVIRVNSVLQAPHQYVPNGLVEFLLWHELVHHLLPGHGHDARFEELETRWPDWERWDARLDKLDEDWNLGVVVDRD